MGKSVQAALLLPATDAEPEAVLQVPTVNWRLRAFDDTSYLWVTGDLESKFAAVATVPAVGSGELAELGMPHPSLGVVHLEMQSCPILVGHHSQTLACHRRGN
jgi:hypothetical protein